MSELASIMFTPDGTGHCLYHEEIELQSIGVLACTRASHVEFDADRQQWTVTAFSNDDTVLFRSPSRQVCLAWEREHLTPIA